jgi:hypothetical protein
VATSSAATLNRSRPPGGWTRPPRGGRTRR